MNDRVPDSVRVTCSQTHMVIAHVLHGLSFYLICIPSKNFPWNLHMVDGAQQHFFLELEHMVDATQNHLLCSDLSM